MPLMDPLSFVTNNRTGQAAAQLRGSTLLSRQRSGGGGGLPALGRTSGSQLGRSGSMERRSSLVIGRRQSQVQQLCRAFANTAFISKKQGRVACCIDATHHILRLPSMSQKPSVCRPSMLTSAICNAYSSWVCSPPQVQYGRGGISASAAPPSAAAGGGGAAAAGGANVPGEGGAAELPLQSLVDTVVQVGSATFFVGPQSYGVQKLGAHLCRRLGGYVLGCSGVLPCAFLNQLSGCDTATPRWCPPLGPGWDERWLHCFVPCRSGALRRWGWRCDGTWPRRCTT